MGRKCVFVLITILVLLFTINLSAEAALYDMGDGTVLQVKDDASQLLWLQDASLAESNTFGVTGINAANGTMDSWNTASAWIAALNSAMYAGYSDWRLPYTVQPDPNCQSVNAEGQGYGSGCSASEMPNLNINELGGSHPFTNFNVTGYWSGTAYSGSLSSGYWYYLFSGDWESCCLPATEPGGSVIAVRDCPECTIVPEPVSSTLFIIGGAALGFGYYIKKRRK